MNKNRTAPGRFPAIALLLCVVIVIVNSHALGQKSNGILAFTISMEEPNTHFYHVDLRCGRLKGETQDFKMPAWTPGYYRIMDYAKNVLNFHAADGAGKPLMWEKTAKNVWRVKSGRATTVTVSYDVYAFTLFVAESYLGDTQGFISPAGVFMHPANHIQHPVTVTVKPFKQWSKISTGLEPVQGLPNTFYAQDFDVLYDCPILLGNQEILSFEVRGIPHFFVGQDLGAFDRKEIVSDLKKIVEAAATLMGEIPYTHYTFMVIGPGGGGLEHRNSTALTFNPSSLNSAAGYRNWLSFVAHEYFHLYNVKSIRPVALGPFDYDKENYTKMLWVSEGFTVYYEDLILNRAGIFTRNELLDRARSTILRHENIPGHLFQSATESSFDTWIQFFNRGENATNFTISYYDKGCTLGMLLDFKIRHQTKNSKSLDDVMRTLYQTYFKEKKRGFTDREFRDVCEKIAGCSLSELFDVYASTVKDIDYPKYIAYAGLDIDVRPVELPSAYFGATVRDRNGSMVVTSIEWDSPAWHSGLSVQDAIIEMDSVEASALAIENLLKSKKPSDRLRILVSRREQNHEIELVLGKKYERSFRIKPIGNPSPLQSAILKSWAME